MGKPAARQGDMHQCPQRSGSTAHVGGPISAGSADVNIGGKPAATVSHSCVCEGPSDTIAAGSATVLINGKPAARCGDATAHGGLIIAGEPSVLIG